MLEILKNLKLLRLGYRGKFVCSLSFCIYFFSSVLTEFFLFIGFFSEDWRNPVMMLIMFVSSLFFLWISCFSKWSVVDRERIKSEFFYFKADTNDEKKMGNINE